MYKIISMLFICSAVTACAHESNKPINYKVWHDEEGHKIWLRAMDDQYA